MNTIFSWLKGQWTPVSYSGQLAGQYDLQCAGTIKCPLSCAKL